MAQVTDTSRGNFSCLLIANALALESPGAYGLGFTILEKQHSEGTRLLMLAHEAVIDQYLRHAIVFVGDPSVRRVIKPS